MTPPQTHTHTHTHTHAEKETNKKNQCVKPKMTKRAPEEKKN